jgi:hypothetical protein
MLVRNRKPRPGRLRAVSSQTKGRRVNILYIILVVLLVLLLLGFFSRGRF